MKGRPFIGFTLALAHISMMVPNCIQIHADVRLVGDFALSQLTSNCAQEHMDQSRLVMLRCQWLNFLQSSFWSKGLLDLSISTPTASMCALARTRSHSARSAVRTSHFGPDCSKVCRDTRVLWIFLGAKPTSLRTISIGSRRHPRSWWAMLWRMHSPRKEQAFFLLPMARSQWTRSHGLSNSAPMPPVYLLLRLLHEVSLLTLRMFCLQHDAPGNVNAPSWKVLPRTHWSRMAKGIITVCENSTPARGALDWLHSTTCSGPPSSHPSDPVCVGHQMQHESHRLRCHRGVHRGTSCGQIAQHVAGKKSRAIRLVNECLGYLTRAGRDVLARIQGDSLQKRQRIGR